MNGASPRQPERPLWMEIDPAALAHNLAYVRQLAGQRRLIASVKANAYGHGAVEIARRLETLGVDTLWTGSIAEAIAMREAGIKARILLFAGYLPAEIPQLLAHGFVPTIYDREGALAVSGAARPPAPIYIKVDSGLGRLGVPLPEAESLIREIAALPNIQIEGIYSHLPFADAAGRDWALAHYHGFAALLERLTSMDIRPEVTQVWASSGLLAQMPDICNAVCVGHLFYGLSTVSEDVAPATELRPALSAIKTRLIHVAHHAAGEDLATGGSYGGKNARVTGVVPLGLGDGMRRPIDGQSLTLVLRGRRVPVLGVSLEHTTLDLTELGAAEVGDEVTVIGAGGSSFKDLARTFGCSELEAMMSFSGKLIARN
ncbi:MAG: alanine racemase [Dongiaceae bacterium]